MSDQYKPVFKIMERDGKKSLWVTMPNEEAYNIWDLTEKEFTEDVENAIIHAFELGIIVMEQLMDNLSPHISHLARFLEVGKK